MSSTKSTFDVTAIWNKLSSTKITALAWNPDKESILGFGTDEGRVGTLDAFNSRYSGDPKTGHSKSGIIQKPDVFDIPFSNGRLASLDHFIVKKYFFVYKMV